MFSGSTKQLLARIGLGLGLAVMTFTAPMTDSAHAAPTKPTVSGDQSSCESQGYQWDSKAKKCANLPCPDGGQPGDAKVIKIHPYRGTHYLFCNGFTGDWEQFA